MYRSESPVVCSTLYGLKRQLDNLDCGLLAMGITKFKEIQSWCFWRGRRLRVRRVRLSKVVCLRFLCVKVRSIYGNVREVT